MLNEIKKFFENRLLADMQNNDQKNSEKQQHSEQLAMAALMLEVAASDYKQQPEEKTMLVDLIKKSFSLKQQDADELVSLATREHADSTDYFEFTRLINDSYSAEKKIELIQNLWHIAYADKELHPYEEHVIRRIADLIYVSHQDFIASKLTAEAKQLA